MRFIVSLLTTSLLTSVPMARAVQDTTHQEVGYVVEIMTGDKWEATSKEGSSRPLTAGAGVRAADIVRVRRGSGAANAESRLSILYFATGTMRQLRSGATVGNTTPQRGTTMERLIAALRHWIDSETVGSGLVRGATGTSGASLVHEDVLFAASGNWQSILRDVPPGTYEMQFRRLDERGRPAGDWSIAYPLEVTPRGMQSPSVGSDVGPGLWQMMLRDVRDAARGGEAWILITTDSAVAAQFASLDDTLRVTAEREGAEARVAITRVRRAALLELSRGAAAAR